MVLGKTSVLLLVAAASIAVVFLVPGRCNKLYAACDENIVVSFAEELSGLFTTNDLDMNLFGLRSLANAHIPNARPAAFIHVEQGLHESYGSPRVASRKLIRTILAALTESQAAFVEETRSSAKNDAARQVSPLIVHFDMSEREARVDLSEREALGRGTSCAQAKCTKAEQLLEQFIRDYDGPARLILLKRIKTTPRFLNDWSVLRFQPSIYDSAVENNDKVDFAIFSHTRNRSGLVDGRILWRLACDKNADNRLKLLPSAAFLAAMETHPGGRAVVKDLQAHAAQQDCSDAEALPRVHRALETQLRSAAPFRAAGARPRVVRPLRPVTSFESCKNYDRKVVCKHGSREQTSSGESLIYRYAWRRPGDPDDQPPLERCQRRSVNYACLAMGSHIVIGASYNDANTHVMTPIGLQPAGYLTARAVADLSAELRSAALSPLSGGAVAVALFAIFVFLLAFVSPVPALLASFSIALGAFIALSALYSNAAAPFVQAISSLAVFLLVRYFINFFGSLVSVGSSAVWLNPRGAAAPPRRDDEAGIGGRRQ